MTLPRFHVFEFEDLCSGGGGPAISLQASLAAAGLIGIVFSSRAHTGLPEDLAESRQASRDVLVCGQVVSNNEVAVIEDLVRATAVLLTILGLGSELCVSTPARRCNERD